MSISQRRREYRNVIGLLLFFDSLVAGGVLCWLFAWWWALVGVGVALHVLVVAVAIDRRES